jgi:hypothetical protein
LGDGGGLLFTATRMLDLRFVDGIAERLHPGAKREPVLAA